MTENKKPQLHVSGLEMLSKCGEQFRRRYIEKEKRPPGIAAIVGTSTHRSIEKNLKSKMEKGSLLSLEEIKDTARDALENNWVSGVALNDDEIKIGLKKCKAEAIDKAIRLSALHHEKKAPDIKPTHLERKWVIEIPDYPFDLVGQIDIQEGGVTIRDTKTSGKTPTKTVADESLQLTAYALAVKIIDGKAPEKVQLDYLIDAKEPSAQSFGSTRDDDDFQVLLHRVEAAIIIIEKGAFMPARETDWWCLSMDTEILTKNGWKRANDISLEDFIMTRNEFSGLLEWQKPNKIFIKKHETKRMVSYEGNGVNYCVTPDHRMIVRSMGRGRWRWTTAEQIENKGSICYPVSGIMYRPGVKLSDDLLKLSGWLCSKGHFRNNSVNIEITQSTKSKYYNSIIELLNKLQFKYSIYTAKNLCSRFFLKEAASVFIRENIQKNKGVPSWLWQADARQFRVWLSTLTDGDGSRRKNGITLGQKDQTFIDDLQILCLSNRISAVKSKLKTSSTGGKYSSLSMIDGITERIPESVSGEGNKHFLKDAYADDVWCVSVPNETIVTRRNGKPLIVGNCSPKWCGWHGVCRYVKQPKQFQI